MPASKKQFPWRTLIYFLIAVYVFLDFKVFNGPIQRKLISSRINRETYRKEAEEKGWVAIINREAVTLDQLELATFRYLHQRGLEWDDLSPAYQGQITNASLATLIDDTLIRQYADGSNFKVPQSEIDTFIERWEKQFPSSEALIKRSALQGLSKADRDAELARIWTRKRWLEAEVEPGVGVTDEQLMQWYEDSKEQHLSDDSQQVPVSSIPSIFEPEKVNARHIFVSSVTKSNEEAEVKIRDVYQKIIEGEEFVEMAKVYSEDARTRLRGGELNWFSKHRVPEVFAKVVFAQKKGQVGEPFKTDIGWHIVEVTNHQPQRLLSYEEVKDELYIYLTNEQRKDAVTIKLNKLRESANIRVFTENF